MACENRRERDVARDGAKERGKERKRKSEGGERVENGDSDSYIICNLCMLTIGLVSL